MATASLACHRKEEETGGGRGRRKRRGREGEELGRGQARTGCGWRQGKSREREDRGRGGKRRRGDDVRPNRLQVRCCLCARASQFPSLNATHLNSRMLPQDTLSYLINPRKAVPESERGERSHSKLPVTSTSAQRAGWVNSRREKGERKARPRRPVITNLQPLGRGPTGA